MNRVPVLSRQVEFSKAFCEGLGDQLGCEIVPTADFDLTFDELTAFPHQFIIVDVDDFAEPVGNFFLNLFHKSPDANVIALRRFTELTNPVLSSFVGVQEVLARPTSVSQFPQAVNCIAQSIRTFDVSEMLQAKLRELMGGSRIVAKSKSMREILETLPRLAGSEATVLIEGETGTGKDVIARFATLFLLQLFSDYCQATFGRSLLQQNLTAANQGMRGLIGDPVVSALEQRVSITMTNAMMQRMLGQISNAGWSFGSRPDPIWGNASIDEIVKVRLEALGVV